MLLPLFSAPCFLVPFPVSSLCFLSTLLSFLPFSLFPSLLFISLLSSLLFCSLSSPYVIFSPFFPPLLLLVFFPCFSPLSFRSSSCFPLFLLSLFPFLFPHLFSFLSSSPCFLSCFLSFFLSVPSSSPCFLPSLLLQDNFGFDLQAVEAATKKHEAIETDIAAYEERVQVSLC